MANLVLFHVEESEININKTLSWPEDSVQGNFRGDVNLVTPIIDIQRNTYLTVEHYLKYNYCFIYNFQRYYFIRNVDIIEGNIIRYYLEEDVLYTFASLIKNQTAHILRNEYSYDNYIDDHLKTKSDLTIYNFHGTTTGNVNITYSTKFDNSINRNTEYNCVINCLTATTTQPNNDVSSYNVLPDISTEASNDCTSSMIQLVTWTGLQAVVFLLLSVYSSKMTWVKNITILPFLPQKGTNLGTNVLIADQSMAVSQDVYLSKYGSRERILHATFTINGIYNDFRDLEPYTSYEVFLPYVGWVKLNGNEILNCVCRVYYAVDYESGNALCYILNVTRNSIIYSSSCSLGVQIGLTKSNVEQNNIAASTHAIETGVKSLASVASGLTLTAATGNPAFLGISAINSASNLIGEIAHQDTYIDIANVKAGQGNLSLQLPNELMIKLTISKTVVDPNNNNYKHLYGRPCHNCLGTLDDYTGFTTAFIDDFVIPNSNDDNDPLPIKDEVDLIIQKLKDGIIL